MALNYAKGIISQMGDVATGTSKNGYVWSRQTILVEIPGFNGTTYKIALQATHEMVDRLIGYKVGYRVEIGYSVYAREYEGRWFNCVDLVKISRVGESESPAERPSTPASAPAPRQNASSEYEVCENFCKERNCDYKLGTHSACARAIRASGFNACPQTGSIPAGNLEPHEEDLPF